MFGILVFTLCSAGLVYVIVRGCRRSSPFAGAFAYPGAAWGHAARVGVHPGRVWLQHTLAELDATPAQERAIVDAVHAAADELHDLAAPLQGARRRVAAAFRGDALSEEDLTQALDDPEQVLPRARVVVARALAKIHAVLDERQRRVLARHLERHHHHACA